MLTVRSAVAQAHQGDVRNAASVVWRSRDGRNARAFGARRTRRAGGGLRDSDRALLSCPGRRNRGRLRLKKTPPGLLLAALACWWISFCARARPRVYPCAVT